MPRVITLANQKGGVGKSLSTFNLGGALAEKGLRVLLVDLDPQGTLTQAVLGIDAYWSIKAALYQVLRNQASITQIVHHPRPTLDIVPTNIDLSGAEIELVNEVSRELALHRALSPILGEYDYVLIDCPPGLGLLTINGLSAAHKVLIPVECRFVSINGIRLLLQTIEKVKRHVNPALEILGILPNRLDIRVANSRETYEAILKTFGSLVLPMVVKERAAVSDAPAAKQAITEYDPKGDAAAAYRDLAEEVIHRA